MSVTALLKQITTSTTGGKTEDCGGCPSAGLPILLTRYGIDPDASSGTAPEFSNGARATELAQVGRCLRVLREGFVHVALQYDSVPDKIIWMCFMVTAEGILRGLPAGAPPPLENTIPCNRESHNTNAALIAIPAPEHVHTAHVAFAEHKWDTATLDDYEALLLGKKSSHPERTAKRFVSFSPKAWLPASANLAPAPNIWPYPKVGEVFEYQSGLDERKAAMLANRTGFACVPRPSAGALIERMNGMRMGRGMVLALPDPLGEAKELNILRMDAWHAYRAYASDEALQWQAQSARLIDGIKAGIALRAKEQAKAAKALPPTKRPRIRGNLKAFEAYYERRGLKPISGEYDEAAQIRFLATYDRELETRFTRLTGIDADYVAALDQPQLPVVLADHDDTPAGRAGFTVAVGLALTGGGITDESLEWWRRTLELKATDRRNIALRAALGDQSPLVAMVEKRETDLFTYLWEQDSGSLAKADDIVRNILLAEPVKAQYKAVANAIANNTLNTIEALKRRYDLQSAKAAAANTQLQTAIKKSALQMTDAGYARLGHLQKQIARANATWSSGLHMLTAKMSVTPGDLFRYAEAFGDRPLTLMDEHLEKRPLAKGEKPAKPGERFRIENKKTLYRSMKEFALDEARLARQSNGGKAMVEFTLVGTRAELDRLLAEVFIHDVDARVRNHAAATSLVIVEMEAAAAAHITSLKNLPARLTEAEVTERVARLGRHGAAVAARLDVGLTGLAGYLNFIHLSNMTRNLIEADAFHTEEARVAFASGVFGAAGVGSEMLGKIGVAIQTFDRAGARVAGEAAEAAAHGANRALASLGLPRLGSGLTARAGALIGVGTVLGSFAVALDSVQMGMVAKDGFGAGDIDSFAYNSVGSIVFGGSALALFASAGAPGNLAALSGVYKGFIALFGVNPLVAGLVLLAVGVLFAYLAWQAADAPITTWIKRSRFGDDTARRFNSMAAELGGLQLVNLGFDIHLRWADRPFKDLRNPLSNIPEEVVITIDYPATTGSTLVYGLVVSGPGARACFTPVGVGALDITHVPLPNVFMADRCPRYNADQPVPDEDAEGGGHHSGTMVITGQSIVTDENVSEDGELQHPGAGVEEESRITETDLSGLRHARCKIEHTWQIDADRFDKAELVIRYFPDAEQPHRFIDTTYAILD